MFRHVGVIFVDIFTPCGRDALFLFVFILNLSFDAQACLFVTAQLFFFQCPACALLLHRFVLCLMVTMFVFDAHLLCF